MGGTLFHDIPGYTFVFKSSIFSHGGSGFFISNDLSYKIREDLLIQSPELCECLFIEIIFSNKRNILCGCIYRHPNTSIQDFNLNFLSPLISKLSLESKLCFIMGDFNIDLIKSSTNMSISNFYQIMCSSYFAPYILQPSRVTQNSQTLIDNIFFNSLDYKTSSGNFEYQISDHLIQFLVLHDFFHPISIKNTIVERDYRFFNHDEFQKELLNINWEVIFSSNETDSYFDYFFHTLNYILDEHAPFKTLTKKERTLKLKPWITNDIKFEMKVRDRLFRQYCHAKNVEKKLKLHTEYKKARNHVKNVMAESKKNYYNNYFDRHKNNISKTWDAIRSIVSIKSKTRFYPTSLKHDGKLITDLKDIAELFNNFFINIGPTIANKIHKSSKKFNDYLKHLSMTNSLYFKPTTEDEVIKIIKNLNNGKSLGPNSIPIRILKYNDTILSKPLSKIINLSLKQGVFPHLCKSAKVLPLFKKGDHLDCNNYRPISLLSIFSKIFEKIVYTRVYDFLN